MTDFETRFNRALEEVKYSPFGDSKVYAKAQVRREFRDNVFIYGTVGPNALHSGGAAKGNTVAWAAAHWVRMTKQHQQHHSLIAQREFHFYDPGPRAAQLILGEYQMMDMYYGMNNDLFRNRKLNIAEFIHKVMEFDRRGVAFDPNQSGRDAFMAAFPGAGEGWKKHPDTDAAYGHSATKEMSKIIREGIKTFGGKLIFEGKSVFGAGIFEPRAYQGDTDLEAQELFKYFKWPVTPDTPFGDGSLEFHWGGRPTSPTRAHFLTNWNYAGIHNVHRAGNRVNQDDNRKAWREYLEKVMGHRHGLRQIWNNFRNFPPGMIVSNPAMVARLNLHSDFAKMEMVIAQLSALIAQHRRPPG